MKTISLLVTLFSAVAANCLAATVTVDGTGQRQLRRATADTPVLAGSKIWVGYFFGLTDAQVIANQHDSSLLESKFISFGLGGAVGQGVGGDPDGVGGAPGYFTFVTTASVEGTSPTFVLPSAPTNNSIYIWAFDSTSSPTSATQQAIFTSTASNWKWPTANDGFSDRVISPDDSLSLLVGSVDSNGVYLQAMPEPGSCALLVMGAVGLLGGRPARRRN